MEDINALADTLARLNAEKTKSSDIIFGTVKGVSPKLLDVLIDGASAVNEVVRACNPEVDDRVVIVKKNTTWIATSVIGGETRDLSQIYAIGDVITTTTSANPSLRFGGTWEQFAQGRTLVGVDVAQAEFNAVNKTGGAKTVTLSIDQMPSHDGHIYNGCYGGNFGGKYLSSGTNIWSTYQTAGRGWSLDGNEVIPAQHGTGSNQAHENMPPYISVYFWRRTA